MTAFPANELEESLEAAARTGDDAKLLRALARNVVCIAQPGPPAGQATVRLYLPGERPLPVAEGADGRPHVLAFTSFAQLDRFYDDPEIVWSQQAAGVLAADWPEDAPLFLNAGGDGSVVLEPGDVSTVALLFAGANVPEAFKPGPATALRTAAPNEEPPELAEPLRRVAAEHPEVREIRWGLLTLAEPEARVWPVFGFAFDADADAEPALDAATAALAGVGVYAELRRFGGDTDDPVDEWLQAEGHVLADARAAQR